MELHGFILALAVLATSLFSSVMGMGGGFFLMLVLLALLPPGEALLMHGILQLAANGYRGFLNRIHMEWKTVGYFALGSALAGIMLWDLNAALDKNIMLTILGVTPLLSFLPGFRFLSALSCFPLGAVLCGSILITLKMLCGVSGPLMDVFFTSGNRTRHAVVASKAAIQSIGHLIKIVLALKIVAVSSVQNNNFNYLNWIIFLVLLSFTGTYWGKKILDNITDRHFQTYTRWVLIVLGIGASMRGLWGLMAV